MNVQVSWQHFLTMLVGILMAAVITARVMTQLQPRPIPHHGGEAHLVWISSHKGVEYAETDGVVLVHESKVMHKTPGFKTIAHGFAQASDKNADDPFGVLGPSDR